MSISVIAPAVKPRRRRCANCNLLFDLTKVNRRFCTLECKNEFHRHGSAFGPLKLRLEKLVKSLLSKDALIHAGFVHRSILKPGRSEELREQVEQLTRIVTRLDGVPVDQTAPALRGSVDMLASLLRSFNARLDLAELALGARPRPGESSRPRRSRRLVDLSAEGDGPAGAD